MILHLSQDLMLVARVSAASRVAGISFKSLSSAKSLLEWITGREPGGSTDKDLHVFVDLQLPDLSIADTLTEIGRQVNPASIVAYAQHVRTDLLDNARSTGVGVILTRGQFDHQLENLVSGAA